MTKTRFVLSSEWIVTMWCCTVMTSKLKQIFV